MASLAITATQSQPQLFDVRTQTNRESGGMMDTVRRITPFILGFIATTISSMFLGFIPGILIGTGVALLASLANMTLCSIWDSCQHSHPQGHQAPTVTPWYHRIVSWLPTSFGSSEQHPSHAHGHVGAGGGHFREQVHSGRGGPAPTGSQGHVGAGGGHMPPPGYGVPPPHGAPGHVAHGGGHMPPPGHGVPPPHGAPGNVGVGSGHYH